MSSIISIRARGFFVDDDDRLTAAIERPPSRKNISNMNYENPKSVLLPQRLSASSRAMRIAGNAQLQAHRRDQSRGRR
jgi:hypothetical protein